MRVKSSDGLASPTCWWGGPKGIIAPPCKYKAGKSWEDPNKIKNEPWDNKNKLKKKKKKWKVKTRENNK